MNEAVLEYHGLRYRTHSHVYAPHDDTWLLVDAVRGLGGLEGRTVVEVGCGAGLGLIAAAVAGARGVGTDRNVDALRLARANAALNGVDGQLAFVHADLAGPVDLGAVDVLLFNPPYLPTDPEERLPGDLNLAFDGGPSGNETLLRFTDQLVAARTVPRTLILVTSSLNDRAVIHQRLVDAGYGAPDEVGRKAFPFERLYAERFRAQM